MLIEKGIEFELVTEVPWNKGASVEKLNPLGKVPVLILGDGSTVYESSYIVEYLERHHPSPSIVPQDCEAYLAHRKIEVLADGACDAIVLAVIERTRAPERQSPEWISRQREKASRALRAATKLVPSNGDYVVDNTFGLADIALVCLTDYIDLRFSEIDWRKEHSRLAPLMERLAERESVRSTMPTVQKIADVVA